MFHRKPLHIPMMLLSCLASALFGAAALAAGPENAPAVQSSSGSAATPGQGPMQVMKSKHDELKRLLQQPKGKVRTAKVKELADSLLEYSELARLSLGDKQWTAVTEAQHKEFTGLLRALIEKNYIEQTEKSPEFKVEWQEQELGQAGDRARVVTLASAKGGEIGLEYHLKVVPGKGWIVYDLLVDDVSMTHSYYKTFSKILAKDGWNGLIQRMKRKLAGGKDEELDSGAREAKKRSK